MDQFNAEIDQIRAAAFASGGLVLLERVEVELAVALPHLRRIRRGRPMDDIVEQEIRGALSRARELIATHS